MSPAIQRLANCSAKVIMMTGTPTGETLFFPGIKNIKVIKEDRRVKDVEIHMCKTKNENQAVTESYALFLGRFYKSIKICRTFYCIFLTLKSHKQNDL